MGLPRCIGFLLFLLARSVNPTSAQNDTSTADTPPYAAVGDDSSSAGRCNVAATFKTQQGLKNGTHLSLMVALPLTFEGEAYLNPGFFQLASALMAVDHFNQRNGAIVPELAEAELQGCPIQIDSESLQILDTGTIESNAMNATIEGLERQEFPNAIVGPYNEIPATELSVLASMLRIPMVTHRGLDHNLLIPRKHPFVTQVNPDLYADMQFLGDYLLHTNRTDYIAVVYASNADSAIQRLEVFKGVAQSKNMKNVKSFGYVSPLTPANTNHPAQNISTAMENLKASGYRTIVLLTPWFDEEFFLLGQEANKQGLDKGEHFWVIGSAFEIMRRIDPEDEMFHSDDWAEGMFGDMGWSGEELGHEQWPTEGFDSEDFMSGEMSSTDMASIRSFMHVFFDSIGALDFMRNAAFLRPADLVDVRHPEHSSFMAEWTSLNESFIARLEDLNPIGSEQYSAEWTESMITGPLMGWTDMKDFPQGAFPPKDLFAKPVPFVSSPPSGALHIYDAVMAIGIGACKAAKDISDANRNRRMVEDVNGEQDNSTLSGELLQTGIRSSNFTGASGEVRFGDGFAGSRSGTTITYHVVNMFPNGFLSDPYSISEVRNATDGDWHEVRPFLYANGATSPPELLRDPADQNYLSKGVRIAGLTLMCSALLAIALSAIWVAFHRHHSIVVASQPLFLYFMCMGSSLTALAILFLSFDESYGWSTEQLTRACKTVPWLTVLGHIWTYNCLFTKLWRVNRVLQFSRRKVNMIHVLWPAWMIEAAAIILLSVWTATSDYHWDRVTIDEITGETMGKCAGEKEYILWIPICVLIMIPTILTGVMAWKTIDVDAAYSEAKWIFVLMITQCQVIFVGVPMVFILEDISTDGRYLGASLILWTFPMTTMGLIMLPKMAAVHFPPNGNQRGKRGSSSGARVSGIPSSSREANSNMAHSNASGQSTLPLERRSGVSNPPLTQSQITALSRSNPRLSIVTQF